MTIKRTVTVHPLINKCVRKIWSKMVEKSMFENPKYSTALNIAALYGIISIAKGLDEDTWRRTVETFKSGGAEDLEAKFEEALKRFDEAKR
jgi:hypothetical protein